MRGFADNTGCTMSAAEATAAAAAMGFDSKRVGGLRFVSVRFTMRAIQGVRAIIELNVNVCLPVCE